MKIMSERYKYVIIVIVLCNCYCIITVIIVIVFFCYIIIVIIIVVIINTIIIIIIIMHHVNPSRTEKITLAKQRATTSWVHFYGTNFESSLNLGGITILKPHMWQATWGQRLFVSIEKPFYMTSIKMINLSSACPVNIRVSQIVFTVHADFVVPNGARSPAGTILTTTLKWFLLNLIGFQWFSIK